LVASAFVPDGKIVTTRGRTQSEVTYDSVGQTLTRKPVVVLVDRGTASASEIVAAALQQRLGSKVVGRRTFGKGVFGQLFELSNRGALDLVVGHYYTPNGTSIDGKGIRPDVVLSRGVSGNASAALRRALDVLAAVVRRAQRESGGSGSKDDS
jgi:carboxyl-terminal processing protease